MRTYTLIFCAWLGLLMTACTTQRPSARRNDTVAYFQPTPGDSAVTSADTTPVFRIQPGTELLITVASLNPDVDVLLNPRLLPATVSAANNPDSRQPAGYLVDAKGFVNFPVIGRVNLLGQSTAEAADVLAGPLSKQVNSPFVTVRVVNYQVTVLGEVGRPAVLNLSRETLTIPEVISLAGDLTLYGQRENILIVRSRSGRREFGRVDLRDRSVFRSPYYYLQPGDVVYVEPKRAKKVLAGRVFPYLPTLLAGVSLLLTVVTTLLLRR